MCVGPAEPPVYDSLRAGLPSAGTPALLAEAERLRESLLADAGGRDLLTPLFTPPHAGEGRVGDRVELRPNRLAGDGMLGFSAILDLGT